MNELATTERMTADTFDEWCQQPENADRRCELIRGEIVDMPPPTVWHGLIAAWITHLLNIYATKVRAGIAVSEGVLRINDGTVLGPDVSFYSVKPSQAVATDRSQRLVPTLCVEVLSPSNKPAEILRKVNDYFDVGVKLVWVIDPELHVVHAYSLDEFPKVLDENDTLQGNGVLPELKIPVRYIFNQESD